MRAYAMSGQVNTPKIRTKSRESFEDAAIPSDPSLIYTLSVQDHCR